MSDSSVVGCEGADAQLYQAFVAAQSKLIERAWEGSQSLDGFHHDFSQLVARAQSALDGELLSDAGKRHIHAVCYNIRSIAACFHDMEVGMKRAEERLLSQCATILQDSSNQSTYGPPHQTKKKKSQIIKDSALADSTKFKPCCDYFLAHFGSPYPPNDVKSALAAEIGVEVSSITMWFTNNRRRSRWNLVMRDHANNNKELMRQLVDDVFNPSDARPVSEDARKSILDAKAFIARLSGDEISDIFREALAMEPMTPEELKAYTEERRIMQKRLADLKRTQEEREAHKARKAARAKACEEKAAHKAARGASGYSASSTKRKRMDENDTAAAGHDPPMKRANTVADGVRGSSASTSTLASFKRKRVAADDPDADAVAPNDERAAKRVRTSDAPRERKPRTRYVLDADGNPRRLRRKAQFRYRTFQSLFGASLLSLSFVLTCFSSQRHSFRSNRIRHCNAEYCV